MDWFKGNFLGIILFLICLGLGFCVAKLYQPYDKTVRIYKQALKDYDNGNYSNAYFLFSKVGYLSDLKPIALYRQAMCAKSLGDKKSELNRYQMIFGNYPNSKLAFDAKYQAGQLLVEDNPNLAEKYFNSLSKSNKDENYKIAIDYYKARLKASKIRYSGVEPTEQETVLIEDSFRNYLENVPDGRLAYSVAQVWEKFNPKTTSKDTVLIARAYIQNNNFEESKKLLETSKIEDSWAVSALNFYKLKNYAKVRELVETGVEKYESSVTSRDYNVAVDSYLNTFTPDERLKYVIQLLSKAKGKKKDYIWHIKCENSAQSDKYSCYSDLYFNFPEGDYAQDALLNVLKITIKEKNYTQTAKIAQRFIEKYPNSENIPLALFWLAKVKQKSGYADYINLFQQIIDNYPDTYYAYRAFWITNGIGGAVYNAELNYKPVEYPYKYPSKKDILYTLLQVKDYEMIQKYVNDDFIRSWIEYEKGNYASSVIIARDAMNKLPSKPVKSDLRWRLVYPQNYYKQVKAASNQYKTNDALMMAIIRTESTFNSEAQSNAGAIGLMQLMPSTAHEIGSKYGISFNTSYLFNPELNIKLGNLYYSAIRQILENKDVSAIAAYNGGIGAVTTWKSTLKYNDTDEFVEQIPYEETKNYVERVFQSYWNYIRIYQKS